MGQESRGEERENQRILEYGGTRTGDKKGIN